MQTLVSFHRQEDLGYLTFSCDEPGKPATLDLEVLDGIAACLEVAHAELGNLRALIVCSDSPRYFVVGANINALKTLNPETIIPWVQKGHAVLNEVESLPLPVICRVEGYALGGGLELALACDLILASRNAKLGQPEAGLGLVSGWGGSYRLPRRIGLAKAKELFFTARIVEAEAAYHMGLVDWVGESTELDSHLESLLGGIRRCSPMALAQMKKLLVHSVTGTLEQNCLEEAVASSLCLANEDTQARVATYLESRKSRVRE